MPYDIALVFDVAASVYTMHAAGCPQVRKLAEDGYPVLTMLQCESLPTDVENDECMREVK